jgi:hypothetical protein
VGHYFNDALVYENLGPDTYDLDIDDSRFQHVHLSGLVPGIGQSVSVAGSASIRLDVRAGVDKGVVTDYRAWLISGDSEGFHEPFWPLLQEGGPPPAEGLYSGVVPNWTEIVIAARGRGRVRLPLTGLAPGKTLEVQATLGNTCRVEARVLDATGEGVSDVEVAVQQPSEAAVYYGWCHVMGSSCDGLVDEDPDLQLDIIPLWALEAYSTRDETPGETIRTLRSDSDGRVVAENLVPGPVVLRPHGLARLPLPRLVRVVPEGVTGIELRIE